MFLVLSDPGQPGVSETPSRCPGKDALLSQFSDTNIKSLGHRPVDPCLSRPVSWEHPAGIPMNFLQCIRLFFADSVE